MPNRYSFLTAMELLGAISACRARIELREGCLLLEVGRLPMALIEAVLEKEVPVRAALVLQERERPLTDLVADSQR